MTTIDEEKAHNPLLREHDRAALVARLAGTAPPPANMAAILRHNLGELEAPTIAPRELQALREQAPGPFVLDVRSALEFETERMRELTSFHWMSSNVDSTTCPTRERSSSCAARASAPPSRPRRWLAAVAGRGFWRAA